MKYIKKTLKNGLRVIVVPMKDTETVTVQVTVATGSNYESKRENGLSHFLEHMCFKGTKKRPSSKVITEELDGLGSQYNAWTGNESTSYFVKSQAKHFKQVFDVVSDIYLNSTFPEADIEKEKGVIVEEIHMYEDLPHRHVWDLFSGLIYGDQPAGRNIAGTVGNVRAFKRNDFVSYHGTHYVPNNTVVTVSGKISSSEVMKEVTRAFGDLSRKKKIKKQKVLEVQNSPEVIFKEKKTDQTHIVLGFRAFHTKDRRIPGTSLLMSVLGGGMSSRLFTLLREKLGAAYYVSAGGDAYTDHGYVAISAGVSNDKLELVLQSIVNELLKIKKEGVTKEELIKVKEYLIGNAKLELETSDSIASYLSGQEILDKPLRTISEYEARIRKVTQKEVNALAKTIFKKESANLALVGPLPEKKNIEKILASLT